MRLLRLLVGLCLLLITTLNPTFVLAQSEYASLFGVVVDSEIGETVPFATVVTKKESVIIAGGTTNFDGIYDIYPIPIGTVDVEVKFVGYNTVLVEVFVLKAGLNLLDFTLESSSQHREFRCFTTCCIIVAEEPVEAVFEEIEQDIFETFKVENQDLLDDGFFIYPNPANNFVHARFSSEVTSLELVDMNGKILFQYRVEAYEEKTIHVANYPAGFYQLRFFKDGKWGSQMLFVTH